MNIDNNRSFGPSNCDNNKVERKGLVLKDISLSEMRTSPRAKGSFSITALDLATVNDPNDPLMRDNEFVEMIKKERNCLAQFEIGYKNAHELIRDHKKIGFFTSTYDDLLAVKNINFSGVNDVLNKEFNFNIINIKPLEIEVSSKLTDKELVARFLGAIALFCAAKEKAVISEEVFNDFAYKIVIYKEKSSFIEELVNSKKLLFIYSLFLVYLLDISLSYKIFLTIFQIFLIECYKRDGD